MKNSLERKVLDLLEANGRLSAENIAVMLEKETGDIKKMIEGFEDEGIIQGYRTLIDWDKTDKEYVTAMIELKVTPQRDRGFGRVAERVYNFPEVKNMYLMSGAYDFSVVIEGKTMREVAFFVAEKLAPIDGVISTATHFVLRKYKDNGVIFGKLEVDERSNIL